MRAIPRIETDRSSDLQEPRARWRLLSEVVTANTTTTHPSVCIVTSELIGPFKNGGIGTAMTGLAEQLARSGCAVTVLYTGVITRREPSVDPWVSRYAVKGITLTALPASD